MITKITRVLLLASLGLYLLSAAPDCAFACSCIRPGTPQEELERSAVVFSGKVQNMKVRQQGPAQSSDDPVTVVFETTKFWKGQPSQTLVLETAASGASCGFEFQQGQEYIVYAFGADGGALQASLCSRTQLLGQAGEDLAALGAGQTPPTQQEQSPPATMPDATTTTSTSSSDRLLTIGGGIVAALVVGLGLVAGLRYLRRGQGPGARG
jgi:hypothetical protein